MAGNTNLTGDDLIFWQLMYGDGTNKPKGIIGTPKDNKKLTAYAESIGRKFLRMCSEKRKSKNSQRESDE